ncbi:chemotaxis protein [Mycobacterium sp.]|uniref:chemotaxis protein n=1 Tax=Mycobacterium sp. TaxID=1785 RepID=UPI0025DBDA34|nr:chemotaxis protein [Mycobacterium sp.]
MSGRSAGFGAWADTVLAGTGWTVDTVRQAAERGCDDLATAALADGFTAAAKGLASVTEDLDGAG